MLTRPASTKPSWNPAVTTAAIYVQMSRMCGSILLLNRSSASISWSGCSEPGVWKNRSTTPQPIFSRAFFKCATISSGPPFRRSSLICITRGYQTRWALAWRLSDVTFDKVSGKRIALRQFGTNGPGFPPTWRGQCRAPSDHSGNGPASRYKIARSLCSCVKRVLLSCTAASSRCSNCVATSGLAVPRPAMNCKVPSRSQEAHGISRGLATALRGGTPEFRALPFGSKS